jgi:hypothetical protein
MKIAASSSKLLLTLVILFFSIPNLTIAKDDLVAHEVDQLLEFIKISNCRFNRNGSWYKSAEAADHLNKKYQYVQKKGLVNTAEDFIKFAATKSSLSGKEYVVQCEGDKTHKSAEWLTTALAQIREIK